MPEKWNKIARRPRRTRYVDEKAILRQQPREPRTVVSRFDDDRQHVKKTGEFSFTVARTTNLKVGRRLHV